MSLWHVIAAAPTDIDAFDEREFEAVRWIGLSEACAEPADTTAPHLSRVAAKLAHKVIAMSGKSRDPLRAKPRFPRKRDDHPGRGGDPWARR